MHGARGVDPTENGDEPPYAFPAIHHDPGIERLKSHFEAQGWRPFHLPLGVDLDEAHPVSSPCIRCKTCGGYPCLVKAKCDARTRAVEPLLNEPNFTLLTGRKVLRLETDGPGRKVTEVICETAAGEERWTGDMVVLAAGAVNTAVILLASANAAHPNGLANGSDQVGRNYAFHTLTAMVSLTAAPVESTFPKTLAVNDFYWKDPDGGFDFPMGHIQLLEYMTGQTLEGQVSDWLPPALVPDVFMNAMAHRLLSFLVISEDLPMPENRVLLGADGRITLNYTHNNLDGHERLVQRLHKALEGFVDHAHPLSQHRLELDSLLPLYGTAHQVGFPRGRFGTDPRKAPYPRSILQGARAGQSLCGRFQLLRLRRRREPHPDHRRQRRMRVGRSSGRSGWRSGSRRCQGRGWSISDFRSRTSSPRAPDAAIGGPGPPSKHGEVQDEDQPGGVLVAIRCDRRTVFPGHRPPRRVRASGAHAIGRGKVGPTR